MNTPGKEWDIAYKKWGERSNAKDGPGKDEKGTIENRKSSLLK